MSLTIFYWVKTRAIFIQVLIQNAWLASEFQCIKAIVACHRLIQIFLKWYLSICRRRLLAGLLPLTWNWQDLWLDYVNEPIMLIQAHLYLWQNDHTFNISDVTLVKELYLYYYWTYIMLHNFNLSEENKICDWFSLLHDNEYKSGEFLTISPEEVK